VAPDDAGRGFLRRFVQHVLPRGFVRIRHFGYLANACRTARPTDARALFAQPAPARSDDARRTAPAHWRCPRCGAALVIGVVMTAAHVAEWVRLGIDTSLSGAQRPPRTRIGNVPPHAAGLVCA
jgi:anti-sigma factor RsiW